MTTDGQDNDGNISENIMAEKAKDVGHLKIVGKDNHENSIFEDLAADESSCSIGEISPDVFDDEQTEKLFNSLTAKDIINGFPKDADVSCRGTFVVANNFLDSTCVMDERN